MSTFIVKEKKNQNKPLFIFEMANNHQGNIEHGKNIIYSLKNVCDKFEEFDFAFKFQYRNLETFIHPDYQERLDIKNIKRFQETKLDQEQFMILLQTVRECGFLAICTPFDEISVDRIAEQKYDFIKIASCSFTDWLLIEKIAEKDLPVIASAAGSSIEDIRKVVSFFQNRQISFSLMHCIAEYPTSIKKMQLNQIDYYNEEFPDINIGFSTHENPDDMLPIEIAVAKGAMIFEKHVGLPTETITLNNYSANPAQVEAWLNAARKAFMACGIKGKRYESTKKEQDDLAALKRGVYAKKTIIGGDKGKKVEISDIYLAFPCQPGQLTADNLSKYNEIYLQNNVSVKPNAPIMSKDVNIENSSQTLLGIVKDIMVLLKESNVVIPMGSVCEISHHYGLEQFRKNGVAMIDCVNREYCKKILVVLPGQAHPKHLHKKKEETFVILHGDLFINLDGIEFTLHKGDIMVIERGKKHGFASDTGCIFEEISTTHYLNDSFYDTSEQFSEPRKTKVHFTREMLQRINRDE